jgi:hypothetical protein
VAAIRGWLQLECGLRWRELEKETTPEKNTHTNTGKMENYDDVFGETGSGMMMGVPASVPHEGGLEYGDDFDWKVREKWTNEEDQFLIALVDQHGKKWSVLAKYFNGSRTVSQCRNRYFRLYPTAATLEKMNSRTRTNNCRVCLQPMRTAFGPHRCTQKTPERIVSRMVATAIKNVVKKTQQEKKNDERNKKRKLYKSTH